MAGERGCLAIEGFDRGNSPQFRDDRDGAGELVLCTTNGTPALLCALSCAGEVLVGSLLNLDAVLHAIPADRELTVICSGTDGRFALEDAYAAGRIVEHLAGPRSDAARVAERLAAGYADCRTPLAQSAGGALLRRPGRPATSTSARANRSPPSFRGQSRAAAASRSCRLEPQIDIWLCKRHDYLLVSSLRSG